jgi:outer membrane protein assembly factor BamB
MKDDVVSRARLGSASRIPCGRRRRAPSAPGLPAALLAGALLAACTAGHGIATRRAAALARAPDHNSTVVLEVRPAAYLLPAAISGEVVLQRSGNLLIAGGLTRGRASTGAVTALNPVTGRSRRVGWLAEPVHDAGGAVLSGRPFVFGGGAVASTAAIQKITAQGASAVSGRLPDARSDLAAVTIGKIAYLVGGHGIAGSAATVLATRDGIHFKVEARLPVPVRYPGVAAIGQQIWVFGGLTPARITDVIQQVNVRTGQARVVGRMPRPLEAATAFTLAGRIYLAGGQAPAAPPPTGTAGPAAALSISGTVLNYDPDNGAFSIAGRLPVPVAHAAAAVVGGTAYLVGGVNGRGAVPAVTTLRLARL